MGHGTKQGSVSRDMVRNASVSRPTSPVHCHLFTQSLAQSFLLISLQLQLCHCFLWCVCVCVCVEPLLARCVCLLLRDHLMDIYTVYIYRGKEYASVNNQGFVFTASHRYTNNGIPRSGRVPLSRRVSLVEVSLWVVRKMIGNI